MANSDVQQLRDRIAAKRKKINDLNAKIKRLEKAYKELAKRKEDIKNLEKKLSQKQLKKDDIRWKGKEETYFFNWVATDVVDNEMENCWKKVDKIHDAISDEITRLKNQVDRETKLLSGLSITLNNLNNKLRKALN